MTWIAAHPWIATIIGILITTGIPSLINEFKDPDNDPKTPPPSWVRVLIVFNNILAWRAPDGASGLFGTRWSVPLLHYPMQKKGDDATPPGSSGAVPTLLIVLLLSLGGCSVCRLPENVQQPRCVLERNLIACGQQAGFQLVPIVLSVVGQVIAGHFDAGRLVEQLERAGFQNIPCVLAALQDYILPEAPRLAMGLHDALKLSLIKKGYHGEVDVRLRTGKVVKALVP